MPRRARDSSPASELKLLLERLLSDDNYMQAEKLIERHVRDRSRRAIRLHW